MRVIWTLRAVQHRTSVFEFIKQDNPKAAADMDDKIVRAAESLSEFSERGRPGVMVGTRELHPHPSYRVVYEVSGGAVFILSVVHTRRAWPPVRRPGQ